MPSDFTFKRSGTVYGQPAYDVRRNSTGEHLGRIAGVSGLWHVEGDTTKYNTREQCARYGLLSGRGAR